ncbi:hypothetical protein AJ79_03808 [Helicocarpus griseus UAMH5409]|uniref:Methyltransferase type 11 domain-containing protein n=1 Tax=Helicocarpus griseus UAMH5409 TaxID=1447875 RepID=A0A2B7XWC9_9EURO|nr:hypothetical protein AJ79_03808 [Helicocarpus griseus UAMH5409]
MTNIPTQNIYDNPLFFTEYSKLPRSQHGLAGAPEWPSLLELLLPSPPDPSTTTTGATGAAAKPLANQFILDLGCGYGHFCRWAAAAGASSVRGIDVSEKMIERARQTMTATSADTNTATHTHMHAANDINPTTTPILYELHDLETINLPHILNNEKCDLIFSSLTLHYLTNLPRLLGQIHASLKPGSGRFVFSVEHPTYTAPVDPAAGWMRVPAQLSTEEGPRATDWLGVTDVRKYHRTVETYVTLLLEAGFELTRLREWVPSREMVGEGGEHPEWRDERHRPYFLLVGGRVEGWRGSCMDGS